MVVEQKSYYWRHHEQEKAKRLDYYYRNRFEILDKLKVKNSTPSGKRYYTIANWKKSGIITDDYDTLYNDYLITERCENCDCKFGVKGDKSGTFRTLHHDHKTGEPIAIVCQPCNIRFG